MIDSTSASNYEAWQTNFGPGKDDMNVYYKLYFFDLQNPVETLAGEKNQLLLKEDLTFITSISLNLILNGRITVILSLITIKDFMCLIKKKLVLD